MSDLPRKQAGNASHEPPTAAHGRVGRPPRVSIKSIVTAAIEIGLKDVTLRQVAERLDVAVPTLYRHVRSRDELVRLAAFELTLNRRMPDRADLHWSEIATAYAVSLFESFVAEPQLIHELTSGRLDPDVELDFLERFLDAVTRQGFSSDEALRLHHAVALQAIGAAVGALSILAAQADGRALDTGLRTAVAARGEDALPQVRAILDTYLDTRSGVWLEALRALLEGIAQRRGETLPKGLRLFLPAPDANRRAAQQPDSEETP